METASNPITCLTPLSFPAAETFANQPAANPVVPPLVEGGSATGSVIAVEGSL